MRAPAGGSVRSGEELKPGCASTRSIDREKPDEVLKILMNDAWPGNVREREDTLERAIVTTLSRILVEQVSHFLAPAVATAPWAAPAEMTLRDVENRMIPPTLVRNHGNVREAAGMDRSTLHDRIRNYGLPRAGWEQPEKIEMPVNGG